MILHICAVRDSAVNAFGQPIFVTHVGAAARNFADEINRPAQDNGFYQHPEDYELYVLGTYDDQTGKVESLKQGAELVSRGKDVRRPA